jgi:ferrous iron transport protein B
MANITTKILGSEREKKITTALLQFIIPCSAQLSVIAVMSARAGLKALLLYLTIMFIVSIIIAFALPRILKGYTTPLILDLPAMRIPQLENIAKKTYYKTLGFLKEASLWFFVGAFLVSFLQTIGGLEAWINLLRPVTLYWLKLPVETASIFIMGMIRRDFGAAGLFDLNLTAEQTAVSLIAITLFVPCIASFMVMIKERGFKFGIAIWIFAWIISLIASGITAQIFI